MMSHKSGGIDSSFLPSRSDVQQAIQYVIKIDRGKNWYQTFFFNPPLLLMLNSGKDYELNMPSEEVCVCVNVCKFWFWFGHAGGWVTFKSCQELRAADP